jgi:hypothetical protein
MLFHFQLPAYQLTQLITNFVGIAGSLARAVLVFARAGVG